MFVEDKVMRKRAGFVQVPSLIVIAVTAWLAIPQWAGADNEMNGNGCIDEGGARARNLRDQTATTFPWPGAGRPVE